MWIELVICLILNNKYLLILSISKNYDKKWNDSTFVENWVAFMNLLCKPTVGLHW